jgi:hypothetical protein
MIRNRIKDLNIHAVVSESQNPELWQAYEIDSRCLMGYCPGCNFHGKMEGKYLPALAVNGRLLLHSHFPSDEEMDQVLLAFIKK